MAGKYLKVQCPECKNEQVIFNKTATNIDCFKCGYRLAKSTGGKAKIKCKVLEVIENGC